jgi:hypothetical protein
MSKKINQQLRSHHAQSLRSQVVQREEGTQQKALNELKKIAEAVDHSELDDAVRELVKASLDNNPQVTVEIDAEAIGDAVGKQLKNMPAPVVNVPPKRPNSYSFSIQRNRKGEMTGGEIHPIVEIQ